MFRYFPKFNNNQLDRLSEISGNIGIVFFAAMVAPFLLSQIDQKTLRSVSLGFILSLLSWWTSLLILKVQREE